MSQQRKYGTPVIPLTYRDAIAVTPDNNTDLTVVCDALYIGGAGTIAVTTSTGTNTTLTVTAGTLLPLAVSRVKSTGTNATTIVALYL